MHASDEGVPARRHADGQWRNRRVAAKKLGRVQQRRAVTLAFRFRAPRQHPGIASQFRIGPRPARTRTRRAGLNQWTHWANANSHCTTRSPRRACPNSWSRTNRNSSSLNAAAHSRGRRIRGRQIPTSAATGISSVSRNVTRLRSSPGVARKIAPKRGSSIGAERRRRRPVRKLRATKAIAATKAPAPQIMKNNSARGRPARVGADGAASGITECSIPPLRDP